MIKTEPSVFNTAEQIPHLSEYNYNKQFYQEAVKAIQKIDTIIKRDLFINILFIIFILLEVLIFIIAATTLASLSLIATSIAILFTTLATYLIIHLYLQTRKPDKLVTVIKQYLKKFKGLASYQKGIPEHHILIASAAKYLALQLHQKEYHYYKPPKYLNSLTNIFETFSCWCHWEDIFFTQEKLLKINIKEYLETIKIDPINLEFHASLAHCYITYSNLYIDPKKLEDHQQRFLIPKKRLSKEYQEQFIKYSNNAIEEFKILSEYNPNDPWTHAQLAFIYHDLEMHQKEIEEYEKILTLSPSEPEILMKLGILYFKNGHNRAGLQIYKELKKHNPAKSQYLIEFYGKYAKESHSSN